MAKEKLVQEFTYAEKVNQRPKKAKQREKKIKEVHISQDLTRPSLFDVAKSFGEKTIYMIAQSL